MHRVVIASLVGAGLSIGLGGVASAADLSPAAAPLYSRRQLLDVISSVPFRSTSGGLKIPVANVSQLQLRVLAREPMTNYSLSYSWAEITAFEQFGDFMGSAG
jgi:hypothetical protein